VLPPVEATVDYELPTSTNGPGLYRRKAIPEYGHIDCIFGAHAVRDVCPSMLEHLGDRGHITLTAGRRLSARRAVI
jgi:hypothetical protein